MATHGLRHVLHVLAVCGTLSAPALCATAPTSTNLPKITGLKVLALGPAGTPVPCTKAKAPPAARHGKPSAPAANQVCAETIPPSDSRAQVRLAILGENLAPKGAAQPVVIVDTDDPGSPVANPAVDGVAGDAIEVSTEAAIPSTITRVRVRIGGPTCVASGDDAPATCKTISSPAGLTLAIKANPAPVLKQFQFKMDPQTNQQFPNLHSLLLTRQGGDSGAGFDGNATHMQIDLVPTGATDVTMIEPNYQQVQLHFVAAADFVPTNAVVTVYDGSDLEKRIAKAVGTLAVDKPAVDPNAPKIGNVEIAFIDRARGNGRLRIYGKGFGEVKRPGYPVDDYLCDCLERPKLSGYRSCNYLGDVHGPNQRTHELDMEMDPIASQQEHAAKEEEARQVALRVREKSARRQAAHEAGEDGRPEEREADVCSSFEPAWTRFQEALRGHVTVGVNSRDQAIRVERAYVIDMNDDMVDVYFEFTRYAGYAWPFRLAGVDLTVTKNVSKTGQTVKGGGISAEVSGKAAQTFSVAQAIGPSPDPNLTYQYTVLDYDGARQQLGSIVADNFYVIQLSVVNTGKTKVAVPLAGVQAEVEWLHGFGKETTYRYPTKRVAGEQVQEFFMEGPPTLAPMPMAAVSGYFALYQSEAGRRVKVFNVLNGIAAFATSLIKFAGPSLLDAEAVFSGGFIPGLGKAWPDRTALQLQNLTSLSWGDLETVAANGGSVSKYIYIQRTQQFGDTPEHTIFPTPRRTMKQISNILDIEVTGYEVPNAPAKTAAAKSTAKQTTSTGPAASSGPSSSAAPASTAPDAPAATASDAPAATSVTAPVAAPPPGL